MKFESDNKKNGNESVFNFDSELASHPAPLHPTAESIQGQSRFIPRLITIERGLDWVFRRIMVLSAMGLAVLMFAQVIMRYFFDSPFSGIEEVSILLGVWVYFMGMGYATKEREHIHGGIVSLVVSDPYKVSQIRFIGSVISMIAACIFGFFACKYAIFVIEKGRTSVNLQWPKGFWSASMIVGFSMMAGYFLIQATNEFIDLKIQRSIRNKKSV